MRRRSVGWPTSRQDERRAAVEVGVGQESQAFELFGIEEVGFVQDHDDPASPFVLLGGKGFLGLGDQRGPVKPRRPPSAETIVEYNPLAPTVGLPR